ncbi:MAG: hypothetical protein ACAI44_26875 [Candidatus Sericytochromatia bacterium]
MAENMDRLEDLITRPLSPAELAEYQEVLGSQDFQDMVRHYHMNAALTSVRQVVLGLFGHGLSLQLMLGVLTNVWLDCLSDLDDRLDTETVDSWRKMPEMLVQVLLLQAADAIKERESELIKEFPAEYPEMYQQWRAQMPAPRSEPITDPEQKQLEIEKTIGIYQVVDDFRRKLEASDLQLKGSDYLQVWTRCLLQTYLFSNELQAELYFLIDCNWDMFLPRLTAIVTLMVVLKGSEALLLPQNRSELAELVGGPDFQKKLQNLE